MKRLLLVDSHSLIHRAYHAYPKTLATAKGEQTNAAYGFTNILLGAVRDFRPTHLALAFDLPAPTFRHKMAADYKKSRVKPDDELIAQIPRVKEVAAVLNIPMYEVKGFEADDLIGTLARQAASYQRRTAGDKLQIIILTSDRDLMQLISGESVVVKLPPRGGNQNRKIKRSFPAKPGDSSPKGVWGEERFRAEWGFPPRLLPDYKALAGDQSDDIPGVKGIGAVTAKKLISRFGGLDSVYEEIPSLGKDFSESIIRKLAEGRDSAQLSKKLATIDVDAPIKFDWKGTAIHQYDKEKTLKLFAELQFKSLAGKLPNDRFEQAVQDALF